MVKIGVLKVGGGVAFGVRTTTWGIADFRHISARGFGRGTGSSGVGRVRTTEPEVDSVEPRLGVSEMGAGLRTATGAVLATVWKLAEVRETAPVAM